jgi:hypothetical protein
MKDISESCFRIKAALNYGDMQFFSMWLHVTKNRCAERSVVPTFSVEQRYGYNKIRIVIDMIFYFYQLMLALLEVRNCDIILFLLLKLFSL